ncbi:MAG TPA: MFS transporter [Rhodanobacteraceae bacterium]|nr:MFS transporter [Rhodanobacteraceae bacterium]
MAVKQAYGDASGWWGHPRGLYVLCAAEACERFSYFGMQTLLVLYMTHDLLLAGRVEHVVGFGAVRAAIESVTGPLSVTALASQVFGLYAGFVYLTPLLGGMLADRWLGRTATVTTGALLMVAGHFLMAVDAAFVIAMLLLLAGVGCFKGNIATQVGELYARGDLRRAGAFLLFQISIELAVIVSPLVCGTLGERIGWHWGFGAAGVSMLVGLAVYRRGQPQLPGATVRAGRLERARPLDSLEWKSVILLVALVPLIAAAMIGNQQMFNVYVIWGEARLAIDLWGWRMPVTWLLALDAFVAVLMTLATIAFWRWWSRRRREPDEIVKIAIGAAVMALAPLLLAAGEWITPPDARIPLVWAVLFHIVNELGFAMIAPIGLALFSRAAPPRLAGLMVGLYYTNFFLCNLAVGRIGGLLESMRGVDFWLMHAAIVAVAAALLALLSVTARGLLAPGGDQESGGSSFPELREAL